jgi:hypothetical protein
LQVVHFKVLTFVLIVGVGAQLCLWYLFHGAHVVQVQNLRQAGKSVEFKATGQLTISTTAPTIDVLSSEQHTATAGQNKTRKRASGKVQNRTTGQHHGQNQTTGKHRDQNRTTGQLYDTERTAVLHVKVLKTATNVTYLLQGAGEKVTRYMFPISHVNFTRRHRVYRSFEDALAGQTNKYGMDSEVHKGQDSDYTNETARKGSTATTIILAVVDLGYIDMAINLYISSLLRFGLSNYLFICFESTACDILNALNIAAYSYLDYNIGKESSSYYSKEFKVKTHVKTTAILDALNANYSVLITDLDIVFLKDPFQHMTCEECDIQITSDESDGNSGFYFVKNTDAARTLHAEAMAEYQQHPELSNQKTLAIVINKMLKNNTLKLETLSLDDFPNGYRYFEINHRMWRFDFPCASCVIVHNNWIVYNNAKTYRFKEHHLWFVDKNEYYTSLDRGYIAYSNPYTLSDTVYTEYEALKSAFWIGHVLNRTVILPQFHRPYFSCPVCEGHDFVAFNTLYSIKDLDEQMGHDAYRESSFLENPLVPNDVRASTLEPIIIKSSLVEKDLIGPTSIVFTPSYPRYGASLEEIRQLFERFSPMRVLHFQALYGAVDLNAAAKQDPGFSERLEKAILKSDYRQYKTHGPQQPLSSPPHALSSPPQALSWWVVISAVAIAAAVTE